MTATPISRTIESLLLIALAACTSAPQTLAPRDVAEVSPHSAAVSAKLVPDPTATGARLEPGEEYVPPQLQPGNPSPAYPAELLPLHLDRHVVTLRVTFGEDKGVSAIERSPIGETTRDDYAPAFEAAAREALKKWKCWPAAIRKFHEGPGYRIMDSECLLKSFFDVSFTFDVVNGLPVVRSAR